MFAPSNAALGMNAPMAERAPEVYPIPRLPVPPSDLPAHNTQQKPGRAMLPGEVVPVKKPAKPQ